MKQQNPIYNTARGGFIPALEIHTTNGGGQ